MFEKDAGEAMKFYTSIFENSRIVSLVPGPNGSVMGGTIEIDGQRIQTFNGGPHFKFTSGISLFVNCENQEEIDDKYEKLSTGGREDRCGWIVDKFGVSWQIMPPILGELLSDRDRQKADRVIQVMLKMNKIIIQDLLDAAEGK